MTSSERENVALALHNILEQNGFSSLLRSNVSYAIERSINLFISTQNFIGIKAKICGSSGEEMLPLYSNFGLKADMDFVLTFYKSKAYDERTVVTPVDEYQYFIQNCEDYPGYVTLQLVKEGSIMYIYLSTFFGTYFTGDDGRIYLLNVIKDKLAMLGALADIHSIVKMPFLLPITTSHHQGPSVEHYFSRGTAGLTNGFEIEKCDAVFAIPCPQWPSTASEWITRKRKFDWPPRDLITKIERLGACLVPMGFKGSATERRQWKYSFSHSEKYLIGSLNAVQFKCYAVLKLLKYFVLGPVLGDIISSYIIKTSLLWTVECTSPDIWLPPMLLDCTKRCLMRLKKWVTKDFCPNYIMKECNLLRNRYTENEKGLVLDTLTDLVKNLESRICHIPPIMKELQENSVQQLARENYIYMTHNTKLSADSNDFGKTVVHSSTMDMLVPLLYGSCSQNNNLLNITLLLYEKLQMVPTVALDEEVDNSFDNYLSFLLKGKMVVLSAMYQLSKCDRNDEQIYKLLSKIKSLCQSAGKTKFLANLLNLATIYLGMNECQRVIEITTEIEQYFQTHLYIRVDYNESHCSTNIEKVNELIDGNSYMLANDVHFAYVEFPYLPEAIQFELGCREKTGNETGELFRLPIDFITVIDPLVHKSFLQFWCHRQLQNNAEQLLTIRHLKERCEHAMTTHKNIAWNLLGYCYQTVGQNQDAFSAFYHALRHKTKSHSSLLYIAILLNDVIWEEWSKIY